MIIRLLKLSTIAAAGAALTGLLATFASPVQAVTLVNNRAALAGNDQIDWSSLGKVFNPFAANASAFLPNAFSATSEGGRELNVYIEPASFSGITPPFVFQTASPPNGIPTNFAQGDFVLFTGSQPNSFPAPGNPGPLSITFDQPIFGAGTQITVDDAPNFTASISTFDSAGILLGTFQATGTASEALDNSALFLGVRSDTPNISKLVYSTSVSNRAFGVNTLSIVAVPELTSAFGPLVFGALGVGSLLKRTLKR